MKIEQMKIERTLEECTGSMENLVRALRLVLSGTESIEPMKAALEPLIKTYGVVGVTMNLIVFVFRVLRGAQEHGDVIGEAVLLDCLAHEMRQAQQQGFADEDLAKQMAEILGGGKAE